MNSLASIRLPPLPSVIITVIDKVRIYVELFLSLQSFFAVMYLLDRAYRWKYGIVIWERAKCS